jgi:hypothetical protein
VIFSDKWDLLIYLMHLKNSSKFLNKDLWSALNNLIAC